MKYRLVYSGPWGPAFFEFQQADDLIACLVAFFQGGHGDETAALWKRVRGTWVPAFPWQQRACR